MGRSATSRPTRPIADVAQQLDGLATDVGKLGRELVRATTLLEALGSNLDSLQAQLEGQQRELVESRRLLSSLEEPVRVRFAIELLPVLDALQASISAARARQAQDDPAAEPPEPDGDGLVAGLRLIERRRLALLDREGIEPISAVGQPFDPHRHVAVGVTEVSDQSDNTVVAEELRGYRYGERVVRHAEVVVARRGRLPRDEPEADA